VENRDALRVTVLTLSGYGQQRCAGVRLRGQESPLVISSIRDCSGA
jgi:hypothetical protein